MITLPSPRTLSRGPLRAFWLSQSLLAAGVSGAVAGRRGRGRGVAVGTAVFALGAVPGVVRPTLARRPYRSWDAAARRIAEVATTYAAWVTHTTAVSACSPARGGGAAAAVPPRWSARRPAGDARSPSNDPMGGDRKPLASVQRHLADARAPRRRWLLLCLALLRWLQPPAGEADDGTVPTDTYSLY